MPKRLKVYRDLGDIWGTSKPADGGPPPDPSPEQSLEPTNSSSDPPPEQPDSPPEREASHSRTRKIILKTLSLSTVITVLIVIIGIYSAFSFFNPFSKNSTDNPLDNYRPFAPSLKDMDTLAAYQPERLDMHYGRILSPKPGASSPRHIRITGITRNNSEGHHVVLVVDVESQRVCFPKWPIIKPNAAFRTEIYDGGPEGGCMVGLYAVDEEYYGKILEWLKQERFGGVGLMPLRYRLDGLRIRLDKYK